MENREIGGKVYIRLLIYFCFLLLLHATIFSRPIRLSPTPMAAEKAIQVPQPGLPCLHGQREPCRLWNPASGSRSIKSSYGNNGSEIREIIETSLPGRRWGVLPLHPLEGDPGNRRHTHRRSCSHGCRWFPHGSAYGTKSSNLRTCQVLLGYLVLPGAIRLACSAVSTLIFRSAGEMRTPCLPR